MAAAGTPQWAIDRLAAEIAEVVKMPEVIRTFDAAVIDPVGAGPADYGKVIARENELMARAAKAADLKSE
jgi:tripartite-type tricarboxylate transporter receptor subunit TctC